VNNMTKPSVTCHVRCDSQGKFIDCLIRNNTDDVTGELIVTFGGDYKLGEDWQDIRNRSYSEEE
jgi:hypothetical protein